MKTLNKDGTPRKQGSGRKKGANSFANVTLADLDKFCGSATAIPVSRVWLEKIGAEVKTESKVVVEALKEVRNEVDKLDEKISFKVHNFVDNN